MGELRHLHRDVNGVARGVLDGLVAFGFLVLGALGHAIGRHDGVEGLGVCIHKRHELVLEIEALLGMRAELFPTVVPPALVGAEVGHHGRQGRAKRTRVG